MVLPSTPNGSFWFFLLILDYDGINYQGYSFLKSKGHLAFSISVNQWMQCFDWLYNYELKIPYFTLTVALNFHFDLHQLEKEKKNIHEGIHYVM